MQENARPPTIKNQVVIKNSCSPTIKNQVVITYAHYPTSPKTRR